MSKTLVEIASELVQTQVSLSSMSATEIASSLRQVFNTLQELQKSETEGTTPVPGSEGISEAQEVKTVLAPEDSIQNDKVICLECGAEFKQLSQKHLSVHSLTPKEYKKKYGFPLRSPLSAKSLTKARSKAAKKRGLPENLVKYQEERKQKVSASAPEAPGAVAKVPVRRRTPKE